MSRILDWFAKPFKQHFFYFILIFFLMTSVDVYYLIRNGLVPYAVYMAFHGYVVAYLLCLIGENLPSKLATIYRMALTGLIFFVYIVDFLCLMIYHQRFGQDFATIFMQTNPAEASEFIETYISFKYILIIITSILMLLGSYYALKKRFPHISRKIQIIALAGVIIGGALSIRNPLVYKEAFIGKLIMPFSIETIPDLREHLTHPQLTFTKQQRPKNVIMLVGESFSKSHSSLYGYEKPTNPKLSTLKDSLLFIYKNVKSPATSTFASFKCLMSTYTPEQEGKVKWYECTTIPETMKASGYQTHWVSNQSKIGIFDTGIGRYADLCDEQHFVGNKFAGMKRESYKDELIIELLKPIIEDTTTYKFYGMQLMGSHSNFKHRYPESFDIFQPEDYMNRPEQQRENLAAYDNSILYNDSVVYEIMNLFHEQEAILFYFSDHAIDVYESSDDYIAHARVTDPASVEAGSRIPFMIYASPLYQEHFPEEMEQIKQTMEQAFRTDDMIYTLMDIIGVQFKGESLEGRSLFRLKKE